MMAMNRAKSKRAIDQVVIIYNPNSTGNGAENAKKLRDELRKASFNKTVRLMQTKYKGHAERIAQSYAGKDQMTLLISSSGDGGYHELINGILSSDTGNVIAGLLPSGNANDHFSAVGNGSVIKDIMTNNPRRVDVLRLDSTVKGRPWTRYAHSYIGMGISPVIGKELNKIKLNFFNEKLILIRQLLSFNNVRIVVDGKKVRITSIIFANISTMSKVLTVAKSGKIDDGKFEINIIAAGSKMKIFARLFQASTLGLNEDRSAKEFKFKTVKSSPIQLDGEVYTLDADADVTVRIVHEALDIII